MPFLKVVDHTTEDPGDRLRKIRYLHGIIRQKCYTPQQSVSVDERMVKCKGRAPFRQYLPKKPVKWGFKVFALCDSSCGVLCDFEVYTGQAEAGEGLTHAVVTRLTDELHQQGYHGQQCNDTHTNDFLLFCPGT